MARFRIEDFPTLETSPTSAAALKVKLGEMLIASTSARVSVDTADARTGEYRIVLHGTIDLEAMPFDAA